jgi:rubrerythrin
MFDRHSAGIFGTRRTKEATMEEDARRRFLAQLAATAMGRRHLLSLAVEAEEADETGIFDQLADAVDDPKLRRLVERHRDDEVGHARLFRDCLDRLGLEMQSVPDELRIIRRIAGTSGGRSGVRTTEDVVATYALLLAIERRGVEQFPIIAEAFRPVDPETADVYLRVARDERRHTRYCETIGRHYAADEDAWQTMVGLTRAVEAQAFAAVSVDNVSYCAQQGLVDLDRLSIGAPEHH